MHVKPGFDMHRDLDRYRDVSGVSGVSCKMAVSTAEVYRGIKG